MMPLTISARFLTGYCVTAQSSQNPQPEWPPHPARLFMALAAAYFEGEQVTAEREALQWLESLDAPSLLVPEGSINQAIRTYVPANDEEAMRKKGVPIQSLPSLKRHRVERMFPRTHLPEEDDTLHFIWSDADEAGLATHATALESLCARVGRLGHSTSLVQVRADAGSAPAREPNLVPTDGQPTQRLRTVAGTSGMLDRLTQMFNSPPRYRPTITTSHGYAPHGQSKAKTPASVFDPKIEVFRLAPKNSSFRFLDLTTTLHLTRQLHQAMLENVGALGGIPECISGHKPDKSPADTPHIAYIPIPFVGGQFGDGHLLGFGVVVPTTLDADHNAVKALEVGLGRLVQNGLVLGRLGAWSVQEDLELRRAGQMLRAETWTAFDSGARRWASVTPVAFDQHPKSSSKVQYVAESEGLIADMFERMGLPKPRVRITPVSPFAGVPTARDFPRLARKDGSERRHTHVVVEFERPVIGPILIGAGRYRGYGLLKPDFSGGRL